MGVILGKFRRKKNTLQILEELEKEIKSIEEFKRNVEITRKKYARIFIFLFGFYLVSVFVSLYWFPNSRSYKYLGVLCSFPLLIFLFKKIFAWHFNRKISKNQTKLVNLKDEKKKMLEQVMDTETYKVAKDILEKFAPEQVRKPAYALTGSEVVTPLKPIMTPGATTAGLRQRALTFNQSGVTQYSSLISSNTPRPALPAPPSMLSSLVSSSTNLSSSMTSNITPVQLPRSILPRDRSIFDRMMEYLVGDGPSNRYALICKNCCGHNGMALQEEFEYLAFRCAYCGTLNPARKKKPVAPKLEIDSLHAFENPLDTSESERKSSTDSESDEPDETTKVTTLFNAEDAKSANSDKNNDVHDFVEDVKESDNTTTTENESSENISNNVKFEEESKSSHEKLDEKEN